MEKQQLLKFLILLCSGICLILGLLVILGWFIGNESWVQVHPSFAPMQFNTALGFCIFGTSTILILLDKKRAASTLAIIGGLLGLLTLAEYVFKMNLGIDELFMEAYITVKTSNPGRMAPNTALCFFLSGITSVLLLKGIKLIQLAGVLSTLVFTLGVIAFEGYLVNIEATYGWANFTRMAIHTAFGFIVLSLGITLLSWFKVRQYNSVNTKRIKTWFEGYAISILLALFVIDVGLPLGVAAGTLYVPLVLFGWYISNIRAIAILAVAATVFTWLGFVFSPSGSSLWVVIVNRSISVIAIWVTAYQLFHNKRKKLALELSEEVLQAEERFKRVVEFAPNSIILVDKEGTISMVNRETERLFGYDRKELIGNKQDILIAKDLEDQKVGEFFGSSSVDDMEGRDFIALRKDGTKVQVEIGLNPITINGAQMALATFIDVTERREQDKTIRKQMAELKLKNKELEQLAYIASHDLQEPLRTVSNYVQVIEEDFSRQLTPEMVKYFGSINRAIKRMSGLVRALLDFSRLGKDRKLEKTDCNSLVKNVVADLDNLIKETKTSIHVDKMPKLLTYKVELRQLFQNLISNAIKFRKEEAPSQIFIGCEETEESWRFSIKDNGIGIDQLNFVRIFHIFQRLHKNGKFEGNGIGLANCKKIAELHGGDIWVESEEEKGSVFYFTIANLSLQ
ncbi:MAG: ATP-binding protein [Cyclobacteriaceae bacterium]